MTINPFDWAIRKETGEYFVTCPLYLRRHPEFLAELPSVQTRQELEDLMKKYSRRRSMHVKERGDAGS